MDRNASFSWLAALAALALLAACGENMDADAGADAETDPPDTGVVTRDAGRDAGTPRDAGPQGCQTDCELVEVAIGVLHTCARRENGEVICWGRNQELQLGDNRERHEECAPTGSEPEDCSGVPVNVRYQAGGSFPQIEDAESITVQGFTTGCAVREGGELWCWSNETVPETAGGIQEQRRAADLEEDFSGVIQASATGAVLCVIQGSAREVLCFGTNGRGELGNGLFNEQVIDPVPVLLPNSFPPVVILPDGGPMVDGGAGSDGGIGSDGGLDDGGVDLDAGVDAGVAMEDGGFSTTPLVGALEIVVSGRSFACARTADDVFCWGINDSDQLGDGRATTHTLCVEGAMDRFDCSPYPVAVGGPDETRLGSVDDIDVGSSHVCAVQDGAVLCWGDNRAGAVGQPASFETVGLPTPVGTIDDAVQVAAGHGHTCALHADGTISCWGSNLEGQLGDGVADHSTRCVSGDADVDCSRTPVSVATIDDATFIAANSSHTCAIREDGSVWCWGYNTNRQLGDGTRNNRNTPVRVMRTPM